MYLQIKTKDNFEGNVFIANIFKAINSGKDICNKEINTWRTQDFKVNEKLLHGIKHLSEQYKDLGWVFFTIRNGLVYVQFCEKINHDVAEEQKAIILCMFACMLRNHFSELIDEISFLGL